MILYVVKISDDVLKVANVEVNFVDQTGAKKKESMTSTMWTKNYQLFNSASLNQGIIRYMHLDMSMPSAETLAEEIKTLR